MNDLAGDVEIVIGRVVVDDALDLDALQASIVAAVGGGADRRNVTGTEPRSRETLVAERIAATIAPLLPANEGAR